jgi:hypothetical protein
MVGQARLSLTPRVLKVVVHLLVLLYQPMVVVVDRVIAQTQQILIWVHLVVPLEM